MAAGADAIPGPGPDPVSGGRTARGERTRGRLLEAARVAFSGVGWSRARVEDVCRVAGVGHGTFYAYYANKTAILEALVRRHAQDLYALADQPWHAGAALDVRADVRAVITGFVDVSVRDRDVRSIWFAAAPSEPALASLVEEVRGQFRARVLRNLLGAQAAHLLRDGVDVAVAAHALTSMVEQSVALAMADTAAPAADGAAPAVIGLGDRLVDGLTDLWVHAVYVG